MKVRSKPKSQPGTLSPPREKVQTPAAQPPTAGKAWQPKNAGPRHDAPRRALAGLASAAVAKAIAEHAAAPAPVTGRHPLLERFGEALGMGLGVIVTEALSAVPSWNKPVLDDQGQPVTQVEGATRIG